MARRNTTPAEEPPDVTPHAVVDATALTVVTEPAPHPDWALTQTLQTLLDDPNIGWSDVQTYFGTRCNSLCHNLLALYWELGMTVDALCRQPGKYGSQTMDNFAAFVGNQLRGKPYEASSARKWRKFFEVCTQGEVQMFAEWKLGWSQVAVLVTLADEAQRRGMAERIVQGEITDEELQAEVTVLRTEANTQATRAGDTPDRRGGLVPRKVFKGMSSLCVDLTRRLDVYAQAYVEFGNMDEGQARSSAATALRDSQEGLRQVQQRLGDVLESIYETPASQ